MGTHATTPTQTVTQYKINVTPSVWFIATLKEKEYKREFEITLSQNALDDYSQAFQHIFYTDFLIPWTHHEKQLHDSPVEKHSNVVYLKA